MRYRALTIHENGLLLTHAGVLPQWTAEQPMALAAEVERELPAGAGARSWQTSWQRGGQMGPGLARHRTPLRRAERHHPPAPLQHGRGDGPEEQGKSRQHVDGLNALVRRPLPVGRGHHRGLLAPVHAWTGDTPQPHGAGHGMRLGRQAHGGAAGAEFGAALADPDGLPTILHPSCLRQLPCKGRHTAWQPPPANLYPLTSPKARSLLAAALTRRAMPSRQLL